MTTPMKDVQLVRLDPAIEESIAGNPAYLEAMMEDNWAKVADLVHQVVGRKLTANPVSVDTLGWDGYFVVDTDTREVVGTCAFKGQPADDGTAEIAYFTYPEFEGKGYATSMARKSIRWMGSGAAPISSSTKVPPSASAKRPSRDPAAPVNAPRA